jgi:acyl-CoA thioester hydrolase
MPMPEVFTPVDSSLYRFSVSIPIRYSDIDAQRHLNNVAYFVFMEQARVDYVLAVGLWPQLDFDRIGMILAQTSCTYKMPAYLGETVTVRLRVSKMGRKSFVFDYRMGTDRGEIATGESVQVCYEYDKGRSIPIPEAWRSALVAYEPGLRQTE